MHIRLRALTIVVVLAVGATACFDDSAATDTQPDDDPSTNLGFSATETEPDDTERPCDGGAFPGDDEFRELLCAVQWAQLDIVAAGGEINPDWAPRTSQAILAYADDRAAAIDELNAILAEMSAATPNDASTTEPTPPEETGLRDCMVAVAQLIIEANVSAGFDPTRIEEWQTRANDVEALVEAGDLDTAEQNVCELRDDIADAIADPALIPD